MSDVEAVNPPAEDDLEAILQEAWQFVRAEPGWLGYVPAGQRVERALMFRLGLHLHRLLESERERWPHPWSGLTVDSELHRAHDGPKTWSTEAPDILLHVRGNDDSNLLVVEAKHDSAPSMRDRRKLESLFHQRRYRFVWAVRLDLDGPLLITKFGSARAAHGAPRHKQT